MRSRPRFLIGLFLILHGLGHVAIGTAAQDLPRGIAGSFLPAAPRVVLATALFMISMPGFVAAGFGEWGVIGLRRIWGPLTCAAVLASTLMIALFTPPPISMVLGLALDAFALFLAGTFALQKISPTTRKRSST